MYTAQIDPLPLIGLNGSVQDRFPAAPYRLIDSKSIMRAGKPSETTAA